MPLPLNNSSSSSSSNGNNNNNKKKKNKRKKKNVKTIKKEQLIEIRRKVNCNLKFFINKTWKQSKPIKCLILSKNLESLTNDNNFINVVGDNEPPNNNLYVDFIFPELVHIINSYEDKEITQKHIENCLKTIKLNLETCLREIIKKIIQRNNQFDSSFSEILSSMENKKNLYKENLYNPDCYKKLKTTFEIDYLK